LELLHAFSRCGVRVIVQAAERTVRGESLGVSEALTQVLAAEGVEIHTATRASRVARTETGEGFKLAEQTFSKDVAKLSCCA
jgi:pyruvate/2-oxoglutarate dehydrogenase complex dihydrolipoamide dehydrogenase (E3) component